MADCPSCNEAEMELRGAKHRCPLCGYLAPCCDPEPVTSFFVRQVRNGRLTVNEARGLLGLKPFNFGSQDA